MALRRNDAAIVIGRYARTTLVWKAQARALIKVRILAGACSHAARPPPPPRTDALLFSAHLRSSSASKG